MALGYWSPSCTSLLCVGCVHGWVIGNQLSRDRHSRVFLAACRCLGGVTIKTTATFNHSCLMVAQMVK